MATKHQSNIYLYILSLLPIIIVTPARVGCGLILILLLNLTMILGTTIRFFMNKIETGNTDRLILLSFMVFFTIIYKRLLVIFSPVLGIMLSFALFFVPLSSLCLDLLFGREKYDSPKVFGINMIYSGCFSLFLFLFYICRELLAFGSISIPVKSGIKAFRYFPWHSDFWATIPGGFILIAIVFVLVIFIDKRLDSIRSAKCK